MSEVNRIDNLSSVKPQSVESNVLARYAQGAKEKQEKLCCPVDYDTSLLKLLPQEIIEKDYGCGDPSRYVKEGDVVLDLGSGGGKICYMAAQLVGEKGRVLGVDMTDDMLTLARKYKPFMAEKLGQDRVEFHKGYIQDLALDVSALEDYLRVNPISSCEDLNRVEQFKSDLRREMPLIQDGSMDLVVSNCVLNLVVEHDRQQMLAGIFRVLKEGGRVAISDIVSDEIVPEHFKTDEELWSGCISGAFHEKAFLQAFIDAGFTSIAYDKWDAEPWQVVEGVEFRSVTLTAHKPISGNHQDMGQTVIYKGPYNKIQDDLGNEFAKGERIAVSEQLFEILQEDATKDHFIFIEPVQKQLRTGCCSALGKPRTATETKGGSHQLGSSTGKTTGGCC